VWTYAFLCHRRAAVSAEIARSVIAEILSNSENDVSDEQEIAYENECSKTENEVVDGANRC